MKHLTGWMNSVRTKFIVFFLVAFAVFTIMFALFSSVLMASAGTRVSEANVSLLNQYAQIIDENLSDQEIFIANQKLNRRDFLNLESTSDELESYLIACEIGKRLEENTNNSSLPHAIYVFSPTLVRPISRVCQMEEVIPDHNSLPEHSWTSVCIDGQWYLMYRCRIHFSDIVDVIPVGPMLDMCSDSLVSFDYLVLCEKGRLLDPGISDQIAEKMGNGQSVTLNGMTYRCDSTYVRGYTLYSLQKDTVYLSAIRGIVWMIIPVTALLGILVVGGFHMIQSSLVRPLQEVETGIGELRKGNLSYQLKEQEISEFQNIVSMYNTLGSEIKSLKIDMYEEELEKNRFELLALQRQLDPHFFINCLNNLKTLHILHRDEEYQQMSEELSAYLRAILSQKTEITVSEEIERCRNYVRLQKIRYQNKADLFISIYDELEDMIIPAHLLQTFVENSFKYGFDGEKKLEISIRTEFDDENDIIFIIRDNGRGYNPDCLEQLNSEDPVVKEDRECVGIYNVRQRLRLFYKEKASLIIRNDHGACALIRIPDQEVTDEYTDD